MTSHGVMASKLSGNSNVCLRAYTWKNIRALHFVFLVRGIIRKILVKQKAFPRNIVFMFIARVMVTRIYRAKHHTLPIMCVYASLPQGHAKQCMGLLGAPISDGDIAFVFIWMSSSRYKEISWSRHLCGRIYHSPLSDLSWHRIPCQWFGC